jgi:hypothetical protein
MPKKLWIAQREVVFTQPGPDTIIQIVTPATSRALIKKWEITMKGTVRNVPVLVEILLQTTAGTMSPLTLTSWDSADSNAILTTAQHTATAEPTASTILWSGEVSPDGDRIGQNWLGLEFQGIPMAVSQRLGWRVTGSPDVTCNLHIVGVD